MKKIHGPLEGYLAIECASYLAGPSATKVLADLGARVIRIEPVTGDPSRNFPRLFGPKCPMKINCMNETLHANKENISLNLKTDAGAKILRQLLEKADVFMTNYTPRTLEHLHITYEELSAVNPRLVYAYVNGLGEKGKDAGRPGFDITSYWSRGGVFSQLGDPGSEPMAITSGMGDNPTGISLAAGILAALLGREKTGKGDKVNASLYHTAIWTNNMELCASNYVKVERGSRKLPKSAFTNTYQASDGRWLTICLLQPDREFPVLCEAGENPELCNDPRFVGPTNMFVNRAALVEELEKLFAKFTRDEWEERLSARRIPYEIHQTFDDILHDEQALVNEFLVPVKYPDGSEALAPTIPIKLSSCDTNAVVNYESPQGAQTVDILKELGYNDTEIAQMNADGMIVVYKS